MARRKQAKAERDKDLSFAELQAKWYAKLKRSGFKDCEGGRDLNRSNGQTFRGAGPNSHVLWNPTDSGIGPAGSGYDETQGLGDTAKYEYYDRISTYAAGLPGETRKQLRYKSLCTAAGLGKGPRAVRKELNMSMRDVMSMWDAMLDELNLPQGRGTNTAHLLAPGPAPAPVRVLSSDEVAKLSYTPPKMIKDRTDAE